MVIITVRCEGDQWMVSSSELDRDLAFSSGAAAERAARNIAQRVTRGGAGAEVVVHLRSGRLAGRVLYAPSGVELQYAG